MNSNFLDLVIPEFIVNGNSLALFLFCWGEYYARQKHENTQNFRKIICYTVQLLSFTLRKRCPHSEFFWSVYSRIRTEYGEIFRISPYSVRMWKYTDQENSEYGHLLCSVKLQTLCNTIIKKWNKSGDYTVAQRSRKFHTSVLLFSF